MKGAYSNIVYIYIKVTSVDVTYLRQFWIVSEPSCFCSGSTNDGMRGVGRIYRETIGPEH